MRNSKDPAAARLPVLARDTAAEPQRRMSGPGLVARQALLEAARQLLRKKRKARITLVEVARRAKVSRGSTYFFYKDIDALYAGLLRVLEQQLLEALRAPIRQEVETWQEVVALVVQRAAAYLRKDIAICQLTIGVDTTPSQKIIDRAADIVVGDTVSSQLDQLFELPRLTNRSRIFFRAIEIADLMLSLSMLEHDKITNEYVEEATRAATAYLELYLPKRLPRKNPTSTD